jgi:5'(3')-deoxyribonucleotidase
MNKKIVYIDMDGVIVDFKNEIDLHFERDSNLLLNFKDNPDEIPGIFKYPQPVKGAIEAILKLSEYGQYDLFKKKMIITHRKDLLLGDFLIDDREANGAKDFRGELISFGWAYEKNQWNAYPTWEDVLKKLL